MNQFKSDVKEFGISITLYAYVTNWLYRKWDELNEKS